EDGKCSLGAELDGDEGRLVGTRSKGCRAVAVAEEVDLPFVADVAAAARNRNDRIFARDDQLRAAVGRDDAAIAHRQADRTLEDPQRLDEGLKLSSRSDEHDVHWAVTLSDRAAAGSRSSTVESIGSDDATF